jgi:uncharacterized membrane protein HdeD (DUF308 family)
MDPGALQSRPLARLVQREAGRWWWVLLVGGLLWFVVGWLVLRADYSSLVAVGVLLGIVFLLAAINEGALAAVVNGGWAFLHVLLSVFFALGALWAFVRPVNTFFALASVLGLLVLLQGLLALTRGFVLRDETQYWWLDVVSGGLLTLLGIWISSSDQTWDLKNRAAFILLWVGFMAIFRGVSDIALAFSLRSISKTAERIAAVGTEAPPVPAQERRAPAAQEVRPG